MILKDKIIRFVSRYQYPHYVFARSIKKYLQRRADLPGYEIIDVPCGNGETAYNLSLLPHSNVYGFDLSSNAIDLAKRNFFCKNLFFENADIHELFDRTMTFNVLCIINSFFLFKDTDVLVEKIISKMKDNCLLFIITPNIAGRNYGEFVKTHRNENSMEYSFEETISLFEKFGFEIKYTETLAYTPTYGRRDAKLFSFLAPFYFLILNYFQTVFRAGSANYFLFVLKKK